MSEYKFFSKHHKGILKYERDYGGLEPKNYKRYEKYVQKKVNNNIVDIFQLLPYMYSWVDEPVLERVVNETNPHKIGMYLTQYYPNNVDQIIIGLLIGKDILKRGQEKSWRSNKGIDDQIAAVRDFTDEIQEITELHADMQKHQIISAHIGEPLLQHLTDAIDRQVDRTDVDLDVFPNEVLEWALNNPVIDDLNISYIFKAGDKSNMKEMHNFFLKFMESTSSCDIYEHIPENYDQVFKEYSKSLQDLKPEFDVVVQKFWEAKRIKTCNQLLNYTQKTVDKLTEKQQEVLIMQGEISNKQKGWTSWDTQMANSLVQNFDLPLLSLNKKPPNEKIYQNTPFGNFVIRCIELEHSSNRFPWRLSDEYPEWLNDALDAIDSH